MKDWSLLIQGLGVVGTIFVSILAIWGEWFRSKCAAPKLSLHPHLLLKGTVTRFSNGPRVIYYHLKVVNARTWATATNCRVLLRAIYRRGPDQQFHQLPMAVPLQFVWAPAELTPPVVRISAEQILDFGCIAENEDAFQPVLYSYTNNFDGYVHKNEAIRYSLEIIADRYMAKQYYTVEVAWNGVWADNLDEMARNLMIREIVP